MTPYTVSITQYGSTSGAYQAANTVISNMFKNSGWLKTTDTGQSIGGAHPAMGQSTGYEIWGLSDSLQATAPFYVKLEYSTHPGAGNRYCFYLTVGTGTDGTGKLTGQISARFLITPGGDDGTARTCWVSGDNGRISAVMNNTTDSVMVHSWGIERTRNPTTGAYTPDGVIICSLFSWDSKMQVQMIPASGPIYPLHTPSDFIGNSGNLWQGDKFIPSPLGVTGCRGIKYFPYNFFLHDIFDVPPGVVFTLNWGGGLHSYWNPVVRGSSTAVWLNNNVNLGTNTGLRIAGSMLWE